MNWYFVAAGGIGLLGGCAHTILGDLWTVAPLDPSHIGSPQNTGDQNKRYLRWFWHIGSVVLLSTTGLFLLQGLEVVAVHRDLLLYLSFLWLATTAIWFVLAAKPPVQFFKMVPGLVGIPVNVLILLGLF
jgi:hypothetical protein